MTQFTEYASVGREMAALVLFSGGQDSTTCLGWALERFGRVETIGVDYGQRHQAELECRVRVREKMAQLKPQWGERLGDDHLLKLPVLGEIADCALTDERRIAFEASGLPNTFVPGRNLLFFTLAASLAYRRGLRVLVGGMCETDYSGYPDCRDNTLKSLQVTLDLPRRKRKAAVDLIEHIGKCGQIHSNIKSRYWQHRRGRRKRRSPANQTSSFTSSSSKTQCSFSSNITGSSWLIHAGKRNQSQKLLADQRPAALKA